MELIGAAAGRWAVLDRSTKCGVVLGCRDLPHLVAGWKCSNVMQGREVELIETENVPEPPELFGCFFLSDFDLQTFSAWLPISK